MATDVFDEVASGTSPATKDIFDEVSGPDIPENPVQSPSMPPIALSPYEKYTLAGGERVSGPFGPANPDEVAALGQALLSPVKPLPRATGTGLLPAAYNAIAKPLIEGLETPGMLLAAPLLAESVPARIGAGLIFGGMAGKSGIEKMGSEDRQTQLEGRMELASAPLLALAGGGDREAPPVIRDIPRGTITPDALVPAVRQVGGDIIPGEPGQTHADIIKDNDLKATDIDQRGFSDPQGKVFIDREAAAKGTQAPTDFEEGRLHSTDLAKAQEEQPAVQPDPTKTVEPKPTVTPDVTNPEVLPKVPNSIVVQTPKGNRRVTVSARMEGNHAIVTFIKLHNDETGSYEQYAVPSGKTFPTLDEAGQAGFDLVRSKFKEVKQVTEPPVIQSGAAHVTEIPETGAGGEKYGIAERVREERARAGQVDPVPPGEGINTPDSIARGREIIAKDPQAADKSLTAFESDPQKNISAEGVAAVRAHGEALASGARNIEEQFGTESPEYQSAKAKLSDWDHRSKAMQTEWHKIGMAQQGETDIDTGSFTGLERARRDVSGKDFTPKQKPVAIRIAGHVKSAMEAVKRSRDQLAKELAEKSRKIQLSGDAEQRALAAASKTVREAAVRLAQAENVARSAEEVRRQAEESVQKQASEYKYFDRIKNEAIRAAKEDNLKRVKQATEKSDLAKLQAKAAAKALESAKKVAIEAAARAAKSARELQADPIKRVWNQAKIYLDQGMDNFDDIRNKVATDLGMKVSEVTRTLSQTKRAKYLADDLWRQQQTYRRLHEQAKNWVRNLELPGYQKALSSIPRALFGLKVGFHGTVALGTHAPMVAFQPRFWKTYVADFGKMYKMVGSPAYYEMQVQDLMRRPNYVTARRAGLVNDPFVYEDFNSPDTAKYFGRLTGMGNRGYSVLKILRQDMFDQHWNNLPKTAKIPEVAQALSDGINHATGVVQGKAPKGSNLALFAPRLEGSRVMWLAGDPMKAVATFTNWKNASTGDRVFAMNQVKEKAWVAGTFFSLLALNQGMLTATGSKQKINGLPKEMGGAGLNPLESDFLKFKAAGLDLAYGSAMVNMAKLPVRLATAIAYSGKTSKLVLEDERVYKLAGDYIRSQMSPFAGTVADLGLGRDFQGRPLPRKGFGVLPGDKDIPKRLRMHGITKPYTWPEYSSEQFTPIPISEGIREVWGQGLGMSDEQIRHYLKAWSIISIMAGTGARVTEDKNIKK